MACCHWQRTWGLFRPTQGCFEGANATWNVAFTIAHYEKVMATRASQITSLTKLVQRLFANVASVTSNGYGEAMTRMLRDKPTQNGSQA
jgi:hypothetical protein